MFVGKGMISISHSTGSVGCMLVPRNGNRNDPSRVSDSRSKGNQVVTEVAAEIEIEIGLAS